MACKGASKVCRCSCASDWRSCCYTESRQSTHTSDSSTGSLAPPNCCNCTVQGLANGSHGVGCCRRLALAGSSCRLMRFCDTKQDINTTRCSVYSRSCVRCAQNTPLHLARLVLALASALHQAPGAGPSGPWLFARSSESFECPHFWQLPNRLITSTTLVFCPSGIGRRRAASVPPACLASPLHHASQIPRRWQPDFLWAASGPRRCRTAGTSAQCVRIGVQ